jgi:2-keto-4-pentenoate hydratase/2-oxohepta-3-ene-1,7-dioic acid hydratase in catechol pathway
MRWRRMRSPETQELAWHVEDQGRWRVATADEAATRSWLPDPLEGLSLPFQPRSFRDCSLYEQHWIQSSRGYARRFLPVASAFTSVYERLLRRPFPAFKPHPLAYRQPVYYFGNHLSFVPSGTPIRAPRYTQALDYELELGAVLRKPLLNASPEEALDAIGGFVVVNDWSARDIQRPEMATGLGPQKCKHFRSSMSDEIVDAQDVLPRIQQLTARVEINGKQVATTSTAHMLHDWGATLSFLSTDEPLWPGELIATGTLPFGTSLENGRWLQPEDKLRLVIDGVGEIQHTILR